MGKSNKKSNKNVNKNGAHSKAADIKKSQKSDKKSEKSGVYIEVVEINQPQKPRKNPIKTAFSAIKNRVKRMKVYQKALCITLSAFLVISAVIGAMYIRDGAVTAGLFDDYQAAVDDGDYPNAVSCARVTAVEKEISHSYAAIEMFADYMGEEITEETLSATYGNIELFGNDFARIMCEQLVSYKTVARKYMTNNEMLTLIYKQVKKGIPTPVFIALKQSGSWQMGYALVYKLDAESDEITIATSLGETETLYLSDFFARTSFRAYEGMSASLSLGFAFGAHERNCVFEITRVTSKS